MKLFTKHIHDQLLKNGRIHTQFIESGEAEISFLPVVKLFTPDTNCTWLLTEIEPDDPDIAFGLCDLGMACPELGTVRISELQSVRGPLGLPVERDRYFTATKSIDAYADEAWQLGYIKA